MEPIREEAARGGERRFRTRGLAGEWGIGSRGGDFYSALRLWGGGKLCGWGEGGTPEEGVRGELGWVGRGRGCWG